MGDKVSLASLAAMKARGEKIVGMVVWDTHMAKMLIASVSKLRRWVIRLDIIYGARRTRLK